MQRAGRPESVRIEAGREANDGQPGTISCGATTSRIPNRRSSVWARSHSPHCDFRRGASPCQDFPTARQKTARSGHGLAPRSKKKPYMEGGMGARSVTPKTSQRLPLVGDGPLSRFGPRILRLTPTGLLIEGHPAGPRPQSHFRSPLAANPIPVCVRRHRCRWPRPNSGL